MNHLSQNNLLSDNQHGFRARQSRETQLITTVQEQAKNMSSGKQIDALTFRKPLQGLLWLQKYWSQTNRQS